MSDRPTPETDAVYFTPHMTLYDMAGAMKRIERQRDEARALARELLDELVDLHDFFTVTGGVSVNTQPLINKARKAIS